MKTDCDIDFVIPWVDGSDPEWIDEFNRYCPADKRIIDVREERYLDYGLLKYWFRGVEKFAPWVRTVHFVTCGQKPDWLNLAAPKLHWVRHSDYIPAEYLPVFSANPIELMMHRIPGLAEQIVYFNDDFFLTAPVRKKFFFRNGLPCDSAVLGTISLTEIGHIFLNNNNLINSVFDKHTVIKNNLTKWFNLKYGKELIHTLLLLPYKGFTGFHNYHFSSPYTKSLLEEVWDTFPEKLTQTMQNRFRSEQDVNQYLFQDYRFCKGSFYPIAPYKNRAAYKVTKENIALVCERIAKQKQCELVLNDIDAETLRYGKEMLVRSFESILPEKSSFEL